MASFVYSKFTETSLRDRPLRVGSLTSPYIPPGKGDFVQAAARVFAGIMRPRGLLLARLVWVSATRSGLAVQCPPVRDFVWRPAGGFAVWVIVWRCILACGAAAEL